MGDSKLCSMGSICKWNQLVEEPQNKGKWNVVGELTAGNLLAFDGACWISTNPVHTSEKDYVKNLMHLKGFNTSSAVIQQIAELKCISTN